MKKPVTCLLIFLSLSIVLTSVVRADPYTRWETKAALPVPRSNLSAVTYNNTLYVFGGYADSSLGGQSEVYAYNPSNDFWTQKASMNYSRWGCVAAMYNNTAYVFGGEDGGNDSRVEAYSFANDSWTTKNDLPENLSGQGDMAASVGSLIYIFGGLGGTSTYSYDPSNDSYTQLADDPCLTTSGTCAYVKVNGEDRIYIMGGFDDGVYDGVDTMYYYRPSFDDWIFAGKTPYPAYGTLQNNPVIGGLIYFGFGHDGAEFYSSLFTYDPSTDTWNQLQEGNYPREGVACGVISNKLYVVGGRNSLEDVIPGLDYNEQYDTGLPSVSIIPKYVRMYDNQSQTFTSSVSGGVTPYSYQWYLNGTAVHGATSSTWNFIPTQIGTYNVFVNITDSVNNEAQSNLVSDIVVYSQSQYRPLVPDWSNVTRDFFTLVPGADNPVLTKANVTDRDANFVADPFIFREDNNWYMFFEVESEFKGEEIAVATSSDGFNWTYQQIVLSDPDLVLSYPYVFKWEGTYYMIPNSYPQGVILYKATDFPYSWTPVNTLISNENFIPADASIFRYNNTWWIFTGTTSDLRLYYSYNLTDPASWHEHPLSPIIVNDPSKARSGGRVIVFDSGRIIRLTQKDDNYYGENVRAFEIDALNETYYAEHEIAQSPIVSATDNPWNNIGMHNVDPWWTGNGWLACVDGLGGGESWWSIGIYITPLQSVIINSTNTVLDLGQSATFSSSFFGGKPSYSYQWYVNDTAVLDATSQNWKFTPTEPGNYNVYLNVTDDLGITVQSNIVTDIIVFPKPTATIILANVNMTVGESSTFSSNVSGGTTPYSYQWYINEASVPGANSSTWTFTPITAGTYSIYLNVTDHSNVTVKSNIATANVETPMNVNISPTQVKIDVGQTQTFSSSVSGGTFPYIYQWYLNNTAVSGATNSSFVFSPTSAGNYSIYVNVTDALNFEAQSNIVTEITVYQQLTISISPISLNMTVESHQSFNSSVSGGAPNYSYQWYLNGTAVFGATIANWTFTPESAGTYIVYLNVTDQSALTVKSNNATVSVETPTNVTITPTQVKMYLGQSQTFNSTVSNGTAPYSYQWYLNDTAVSGATSQNWTFTPTTVGIYEVYLNVTDALNFKVQSNIIMDITVFSLPTVAISPVSVNMTVGNTQQFISTVAGGLASYAYQWYYINGTAISGARASTLVYKANFTGTYSIYLNVTDSLNYRVQSNTATINVYSKPTITITPTSVNMTIGNTQQFNSTATGGLAPYAYQWYYVNGTAISGAKASILAYQANFTGAYIIYLKVTDSLNYTAQSNNATFTVYSQSSVTISPTSVTLYFGQSQTFNASVIGGLAPYTYQWYVNDTAVPGATYADWMFKPRANGNYRIYANVTDSLGSQAESNIARDINVYSVYLMLNTEPQATYAKGQQVTLVVSVLNQLNPRLEATLTLTVTGPGGYSFYDFQPINVSTNSAEDYSFNWIVPDQKGTYIVETSIVPIHLTAYDAKWLQITETVGSSGSNPFSFGFANNLVNIAFFLLFLLGSQGLSGAYLLTLLNYRNKKIGALSFVLRKLWRLHSPFHSLMVI